MREVAVIGIGMTPVKENWDLSLRELAGQAALSALEDAELSHVDSIYIGNMMSGAANHQQQLGSYIADWIGLPFTDAVRIEAACSSGSASFRSGLMAVASGEVDSALVLGVEKMTDSPSEEISTDLATAADADMEIDQGVTFVALNALIMQRYIHQYGWQKEHFAPFSLNAHANGAFNPNARFQKAITSDIYNQAAMISPPINLMDASPIGDGAAAAVIVPASVVRDRANLPLIRIAGSAAATDSITVHDRKDPLWLSAAEKSARRCYDQSGLTPNDIQIFELHDAFSIMAALSLEAAGFADRGQGVRLALDGAILPTGKIPVATRGGLKARGHPVGATGMYQIAELVQQLRGEAGQNQIDGVKNGMAQNIGGSGSNIITHILVREDA